MKRARRPPRCRTILGSTALVLTALLLTVVPAAHPPSLSTPAHISVATQNPSVTFTVEVYNLEGVRELLGPARPFLSSGDTVDLGRALANGTPDIATLNTWVTQLAAGLPSGILFTARVESLGSVGLAARELSPLFRGITIDYEPDTFFFPDWTWNFSAALRYYQNATALCHEYGRLAIAYPSGRPLLESDLQKYDWNYAAIAATTDLMKVETQDYGNLSKWPTAVGKLADQFAKDEVSLDRLTTQISVGSGGNAVNASATISDIRFATDQSIRSIYVWWSLDDEPGFLEVLQSFSGATPSVWPVTVTESGLPLPTGWWVNLTDGPSFFSTGPNITFSEPNGTYSYQLAVSNRTYQPGPSEGNFTVQGASLSEIATFSETTYLVTFTETGLPAGATWWVNLTDGPAMSSTNGSLSFPEPNGTFDYAVTSVNASWTPFPGAGEFSVGGQPVALWVNFTSLVPGIYPVTFAATGLTGGTEWSVVVANQTLSSTTDEIVTREANGTYRFSIPDVPGYTASPSDGSVVVEGNASLVEVQFTALAPPTYGVNITESGLPAGTAWWANFSRLGSVEGANPSLRMDVPNGSFEVSFASADKRWCANSTSVEVEGASRNLSVRFTAVTYPLAFVERGLPEGTPWAVRFAGVVFASNSSTIDLAASNGTFSYLVPPVAGFVLQGGPTGQVEVGGTPNVITVTFDPASTSGSPLTSTEGGASDVGYAVFAAGTAALAGAVIALVLWGRKSPPRRPPRTARV